jgi:enoyl-CoA hydratase
MSADVPSFETLAVSLDGGIGRIALNRPSKANAINATMWRELKLAAEWLDAAPQARVGILSGAGKYFTAGLDLGMLGELKGDPTACDGRAREKLYRDILEIQASVSAFERCRKPIIAQVQGACVGGGVDIITACDLRYACDEAWFCVKEIDVGIVADVGTLQRLPKLIGEGFARELAYTGRRVSGREAAEMKLVNRCYATAEDLDAGVKALANEIAAKSPLSIRGTKQMITYVRDHSVADGLNLVATWNAAMLFSSDLEEAVAAGREKRPAKFSD